MSTGTVVWFQDNQHNRFLTVPAVITRCTEAVNKDHFNSTSSKKCLFFNYSSTSSHSHSALVHAWLLVFLILQLLLFQVYAGDVFLQSHIHPVCSPDAADPLLLP
jgi:hypothetical protein